VFLLGALLLGSLDFLCTFSNCITGSF